MTDETEVVTQAAVTTEAPEADVVTGLEALGVLKEEQEVIVVREPKLDAHGRAYATGKRKSLSKEVQMKTILMGLQN